MIIAYSTIPEYVAMRNDKQGSWFIHAVTEIFAKLAFDTELHSLFQRVVALMESFQSLEECKQTPEIAWRGWKRDLYFNPGLYNP